MTNLNWIAIILIDVTRFSFSWIISSIYNAYKESRLTFISDISDIQLVVVLLRPFIYELGTHIVLRLHRLYSDRLIKILGQTHQK